MKPNGRSGTVRPLFEMGTEITLTSQTEQEIDDRKAEARRIVSRLATIVEDHRQAASRLGVELGANDIRFVLDALREHARDRPGTPVNGARDEVHGYCLDRLFDELVEEPSNILFATEIGPETTRYDAMNTEFWLECLDLMESVYCTPEEP